MLRQLTERRDVLFVGIAVAGAAVALIAYAAGLFKGVEFDTMDTRFDLRGEQAPPEDVVVVAIDVETLDELGKFPIPRRYHAQALDALREDGAAQISYDVQFTEPSNVKDDNALINAIGRTPHVVLATTEVGDEGQTGVLGGDEVLRGVGARAGHAEFEPDQGVYRRVHSEIDGLDTFSVATVEALEGVEVDDELPDGEAWIDYRGGVDTFDYVSFGDVISGDFEPGTFKDKIVVVGVTVSTEGDLHATPFSDEDLMPGAEIQANAIQTIRDTVPLRSTPLLVGLLLIVALAFVPALANLWLTPLLALGASLGTGALYLVVAQLAFNADTILPVVYPMIGLLTSSVGSMGAQYVTEAFERQRARDTFARFVPEPVVGEMLSRADGLRLGGRRYEVTILFSDIRGFTTFSESRSPEEVIEILNRYLGKMTEAILDHGGTLSSFIGDGIMAIFGAPIEQDDHADRGVAAAREMLGPKLEAFNEWALAEGGQTEPLRMGVGLNSGPVMCGMVGSERRLEYTAIGDTVNTAARLESMTKGTEHSLFVAESTRARMLSGMEDLKFIDEMSVRGRATGINVWGYAGL